jgi:hypothetical protein
MYKYSMFFLFSTHHVFRREILRTLPLSCLERQYEFGAAPVLIDLVQLQSTNSTVVYQYSSAGGYSVQNNQVS